VYKAFEFNKIQSGVGVLTDNKMTGNKTLFCIFSSEKEANDFINGDLKNFNLNINPQIVDWNKKQYDAVDYVFTTSNTTKQQIKWDLIYWGLLLCSSEHFNCCVI
jgi:hypothetical protein